MNDCGNAEIRDQLPDLVNERLDLAARAFVQAHIDDCVDCRDELQLLRDVRAAMARGTPSVDIAYIVGALPRPPVAGVTPLASRRRSWGDWRVAAAVTLLLAGGGSYALMRSEPAALATSDTAVAVASSQPAAGTAAAAPDVSAPIADEDHAATVVGGDSRLGDLTEEELRALLDDIKNFKAVPAAEPDPVTIGVDVKLSSEGV